MNFAQKICIVLTACVGLSGTSHAVTTLDFDSLATGSDITNNPLVTSDGTISASAPIGGNLYLADGSSGGLTGDVLRFDETVDGQYAQLAFDYDVRSTRFLFAGFLSGVFTAQVLDASFNVLDSFFDGDTNNDTPGGPITLSGSGIRYFRFFDGPGGLSFAGVDDIRILAAVPEPSTVVLLGLGLIGLGYMGRRKLVR
jgi:hypothetical protein